MIYGQYEDVSYTRDRIVLREVKDITLISLYYLVNGSRIARWPNKQSSFFKLVF